VREDGTKVSSDIYRRHNLFDTSQVTKGEYHYLNFRYPYQGLYLMDRELMSEFIEGKTKSPDFGTWRIREKASQGLIYSRFPRGAFSRSFVGYRLNRGVDSGALVHHLPNNYADSGSKYGSITIDELVSTQKMRGTPLMRDMSKVVSLRLPGRRHVFVGQVPSESH